MESVGCAISNMYPMKRRQECSGYRIPFNATPSARAMEQYEGHGRLAQQEEQTTGPCGYESSDGSNDGAWDAYERYADVCEAEGGYFGGDYYLSRRGQRLDGNSRSLVQLHV